MSIPGVDHRAVADWVGRRLIPGVLGLVAIAMLMAVVLLFQIAAKQDDVAERQTHALALRAMEALRAQTQRTLHDYAAWGEAYRHVMPQVDLDWAYLRENIGPTLHSDLGFSLVAIAGPDNDPRYALSKGVLVMGSLSAPIRTLVQDLMLQARADPEGRSPIVILAPEPDQPPMMAGAEVISPAGDPTIPVQGGPQPVLLLGTSLTPSVLGALGRSMLLEDLQLVPAGTCDRGTDGHTLVAPDGTALADLCWSPPRPGQEMVQAVLPWLIGGFVCLLVLLVLILRHALATARTADGWRRRLAQAFDQAREEATHDPVTGLLNLRGFEADADRRLATSEAWMILRLGLERAKLIDDVFGHAAGDALLRQVALRLRGVVGDEALLGRTGPQEFAILLPPTEPDALDALVCALSEALERPLDLEGVEAHVGLTVGAACVGDDARSAERLLNRADMALHAARAEGARMRAYDRALGDEAVLQQRLESDLRGALARNEFALVYQPRYDARTLSITGAEALVRWNHPALGSVSPVRFIPLAERTGLIHDLGRWVLETACSDLVRWPGITVAVNMSPMQFQKPGIDELAAHALKYSGLPPERLELELTESMLFEYYGGAKDSLHAIKALGVGIALDDFGTGFSSLGYLMDFRFDRLKIDRRFVKGIQREGEARAIVHTIIRLASALGMAVTAEGIETPLQMDVLREEGCDELQGFLLAKPMALAEFERLLMARQARDEADMTQTEPTVVALAGR